MSGYPLISCVTGHIPPSKFIRRRSKYMAKKGQTYFCEICRQKVVVTKEGFGVLVCCGQEMSLVGAKGMMATWTTAYSKPKDGVIFVCSICKQKIRVIVDTTGTWECCGDRMQRGEATLTT